MKVGWLWELCIWVKGACIQYAQLSLTSSETKGWEWYDWIWEFWQQHVQESSESVGARWAETWAGCDKESCRESHLKWRYLMLLVRWTASVNRAMPLAQGVWFRWRKVVQQEKHQFWPIKTWVHWSREVLFRQTQSGTSVYLQNSH